MTDKNTEMQDRLAGIEREHRHIKELIGVIAQANVLPDIMQNGFECMIAQLGPLRDLAGPRRESVSQATTDAVAAMLAAMQGVASSAASLGIPEVNVSYIGQPRPQLAVGGPGRPLPAVGPKNPNQPNQQR